MQILTTELKNRLKGARRVAILGVGSEFRGDDAAGILVARRVDKGSRVKGQGSSKRKSLKIFLGGTAPENLTGEIIKFKPTHIIIIDTADIKEKPGTVILLNNEDLGEGVSFSTHKLPPRIMMDYLSRSLKCSIMVVGIQPKTITFCKGVSKEVLSAAKEVANAVISAVN